jgi:hypothetical protein
MDYVFSYSFAKDDQPIPDFAISSDACGFLLHGPRISSETGLSKKPAFKVDARLFSPGLISSRITGYQDISEVAHHIAPGGGPVCYFGLERSRPHVGFIIDCGNVGDKTHINIHLPYRYDYFTSTYTINAGYKYRFASKSFLSSGGYTGISNTV